MKQAIVIVAAFALGAFIMALLGYVTDSPDRRWAIMAVALGLLGAGLSLVILMLSQQTDNKINEINTTLARIEDMQKELQNEQKELAKSDSPLVTSLQGLSQYYMEYLDKQFKQEIRMNND